MENPILDLRGNGGGYLNAAIDLSDEFLMPENLSFIPMAGIPKTGCIWATSFGKMQSRESSGAHR